MIPGAASLWDLGAAVQPAPSLDTIRLWLGTPAVQRVCLWDPAFCLGVWARATGLGWKSPRGRGSCPCGPVDQPRESGAARWRGSEPWECGPRPLAAGPGGTCCPASVWGGVGERQVQRPQGIPIPPRSEGPAVTTDPQETWLTVWLWGLVGPPARRGTYLVAVKGNDACVPGHAGPVQGLTPEFPAVCPQRIPPHAVWTSGPLLSLCQLLPELDPPSCHSPGPMPHGGGDWRPGSLSSLRRPARVRILIMLTRALISCAGLPARAGPSLWE